MGKRSFSRRSFIKASAAGVALAPLAFALRQADAGELVPLTADDPMAMALNYHADAATVEAGNFGNYASGQICGNCMHAKPAGDDGRAACALFPGKSVSVGGWCKVWTKGS